MKSQKIILRLSAEDENAGYLYLPKHPKTSVPGIVKKTISIAEIVRDYKGIPLYFDFDEGGELIGIEISG